MMLWKYFKQIILFLIEMAIVICVFTIFISKYVSINNALERVEIWMIGFAIYEIIVFVVLKNISDVERDMKLGLRTMSEYILIYFETGSQDILSKINSILILQLNPKTFNNKNAREQYRILQECLNDKNIGEVKFLSCKYNHEYEMATLSWNFSFLLRIIK